MSPAAACRAAEVATHSAAQELTGDRTLGRAQGRGGPLRMSEALVPAAVVPAVGADRGGAGFQLPQGHRRGRAGCGGEGSRHDVPAHHRAAEAPGGGEPDRAGVDAARRAGHDQAGRPRRDFPPSTRCCTRSGRRGSRRICRTGGSPSSTPRLQAMSRRRQRKLYDRTSATITVDDRAHRDLNGETTTQTVSQYAHASAERVGVRWGGAKQ